MASRVAPSALVLFAIACGGPARVSVARAPSPPASSTAPPEAPSRGGVGASRPRDPERPEPRAASEGATAPAAGHPVGAVALEVPGFDPALVSFPSAGGALAPLVFVAHGAKDLPDAECALYRELLGDRGTLVCLAGPRADVHAEPRYFPDHPTLEKILSATWEAFHARYPDVLPGAAAVYAGYSQGATMGSLVLAAHAHEFSRLLLVEGGFSEWTASSAAEFVRGGGSRVAFVCGTKRCHEAVGTAVHVLRTAGARAAAETNLRAGHSDGIELRKPLVRALAFLLTEPGEESSEAATSVPASRVPERDR